MPPRETQAVAASQRNPKALAACVVLAHPCMVFHPYRCRLHGDAAVVPTVLIGYNNCEGCYWETCEPKTIVIDYFLYTDARLHWIAAPTLLLLLSVSSGNDDL
jgi:hypothetical protein